MFAMRFTSRLRTSALHRRVYRLFDFRFPRQAGRLTA